jgi:hypothetical protein
MVEKPANAVSPNTGALLYGLEVELPAEPQLAELAILVQGLFSPQIVLTDSQLVGGENTMKFFLENEGALNDMMNDLQSYEMPLIGTIGRGGSDCERTLDIMLKPRSGKPVPLPMLSPKQREVLSLGYDLLSEGGRRHRFYSVAGQEVQKYFQITTKYFQSHSERTSVPSPNRNPEVTLYTEVRNYVLQITKSGDEALSDVDKLICDAILKEIDTIPEGTQRTRERLHRAIYGGVIPAFYKGRLVHEKIGLPGQKEKDGWRYLINALYNVNLADSFGLRHGINSPWYELRHANRLPPAVRSERVGVVKLASTIYPQFIDLSFVRSVRRDPQFWKNMRDPELDRRDHLQFVSEKFAKHLTENGHADIVRKYDCEATVNVIRDASILSSLSVVLLSLFCQQGLGSAVQAGIETVGAAHVASWGIEGVFGLIERTAGKGWNLRNDFKNFVGLLKSVQAP